MQYLLGYDSSVANGSVLVDVKSILDQNIPQSGDAYIVPKQWSMVGGVYAISAHLTQVQLQAASLRALFQLDVTPINVATPATQTYPVLLDMFDDPMQLQVTDLLQPQAIQSNASAENVRVGVWLTDGPVKPVTGKIVTVKFTGTTTLVADAWTLVQLTSTQSLIPGTYNIVGMRAQSTGAILARLVIPGQVSRPGVIAVQNVSANDMYRARFGGFGVMGVFDNSIGVSAEFLSASADTSETVWLDLIYNGPSK